MESCVLKLASLQNNFYHEAGVLVRRLVLERGRRKTAIGEWSDHYHLFCKSCPEPNLIYNVVLLLIIRKLLYSFSTVTISNYDTHRLKITRAYVLQVLTGWSLKLGCWQVLTPFGGFKGESASLSFPFTKAFSIFLYSVTHGPFLHLHITSIQPLLLSSHSLSVIDPLAPLS